MILKQLMADVVHLGFESDISDTERFLSSLNRALYTIYTDRPRTRAVRRFIEKISPNFTNRVYNHKGGTEVSFSLSGRAFSFISTGMCSFRISDGFSEREHKLYGDMVEFRNFLDGDATITFTGDYSYTVLNLSSFDTLFGDEKSDIPIYGREIVIDINELYGDFMSFTELPRSGSGEIISGAALADGRVILPSDFFGEVSITYRRAPKTVSTYDENMPIDISTELEGLLPLLCASFMWLDDDADKAQYYMALYRDGISSIKLTSTKELSTKYSTNGWA